MSNAYDEKDIFSQAGLPAREQVSDWVNIKKAVGDKIAGTFMGWWISKSNNTSYKDQIGIAIKTADGKVVGVSVSDTPYMRSRIEPSQVGDRVGLKYEGDKDTGKPQPAKIIKFYNPDLEVRREKGSVVISKPEEITKSPTDKANAEFDSMGGDDDQPF